MKNVLHPFMTAFAAGFVWIGLLTAQGNLGPKDGLDLPPTDLERVKVGQTAPDFTLQDESGKPVTLSSFRGKSNVVLVFYRGHW